MSQTLDNLSYTWNNAGTTFTGIKYNVTDTASASGSLLMDLQVGGVSQFKVNKSGGVIFKNNLSGIAFLGQLITNSGNPTIGTSSALTAMFGTTTVIFPDVAAIGWGNPQTQTMSDVSLYRDAANTLAQRNSTNAQTFRTYGTYTDGSNYRRLTQTMSTGGVAEIKPEGAGTGASGNVLHISGLPTSNPGAGILWNDAGTVKVGT